jgi:thiamine pyrophosphate-dependent acetolactate synthase large subunit-like protein
VTRDEVLEVVDRAAVAAGAAVFTGNGYNARVLAAIADRASHFYMLGSMGLCATLAAGFSGRSGRPVVAVEGDGNALMGLSGLPVAVASAGRPFVHLVLDNGVYETTGSQLTLAPGVDFGLLALGAGYERLYRVSDPAGLRTALEAGLSSREITYVHATTEPDSGTPRPRVPHHPREIAQRFRSEATGAS